MKRDWSKIIAVVTCILLIISLVQISNLKQQVQNLENNLSNRIWNMEASMNNISNEVHRQLEKEASLLAGSEWAYGAVDMEAYTAMVHCLVSPKEYRPEITSAVLMCNDTEYPMTLENGSYVADIRIPLFGESVVSKVQFLEGDTVRAEQLDWHLSPRYECLTTVHADFGGSSSFSKNEDVYILNMSGDVNVYVESKGGEFKAESIFLVECIDDKEITREEIQMEQMSAMDYYYQMEREVKIPFGSTYDLYVEVEDNYGLHHRNWLEHKVIDENGELVDEDWGWWHGAEGSVYDAEGNPLYVIDENGTVVYTSEAKIETKETLEMYRYFVRETYPHGITSTLLADLTGDGEQELIVINNWVSGESGESLSEDAAEAKELRELNKKSGESRIPYLRNTVAEYPESSSYESMEYVGYGVQISMKVYTQNKDGSVVCLYEEYVSSPHPGWNWLYLYEENERHYLFKFSPSMWQGMGTYEYQIFSLTGDGEQKILYSGAEEYVMTEEGSPEYKETWERMQRFLEQVHTYQAASTPLIEIGEDLFDAKDAASGGREYNYVIKCDELG